ncbi:Fic family protein [Mycolicibacterium smegmatis]|uniref:Fic family protein n=1 Tax=Mycolicibacterium smegmatis TaxID=1772 RepID=UPI001E59CE9B|nr:Fic family protein [Mycolicibacterium smegmatis]UGU31400.1 Fic family protein [Mycolicibacterium smegmatis]ULN72313.1 Fic family protein [Mycolicibacterium smegmatis]
MEGRRYEQTHPWISFQFDLNKLTYRTWLLLGEAKSKCQHVEGAPLLPATAMHLYEIYLSKGIHGTTSIEGNTLSEDQVRDRIAGHLPLPVSREYQGREVDNIVSIANEIVDDLMKDPDIELSADRIRYFNRRLLDGLPLKEGVVPGETRTHSVGVGSYRGAPAEDCDYLLDRMAKWLNDLDAPDRPELAFPIAVLKAILAHLYIAWIHPFGDGNGRTARLIELQLMLQAGASVPASHLLSDHYNRTRDMYYIELEKTSKREGYPVEGFIDYALQGFVDELREQIATIRAEHIRLTWQNYVHDMYPEETPAKIRQRHLALDMVPMQWYSPAEIRNISPRVAADYAGKKSKTITRDLNELEKRNIIVRHDNRFQTNRHIIEAFRPPVPKPTIDP